MKQIRKLLTDVQAIVTKLLKNKLLTNEVAELKHSVERNRKEVSNLKDELVNQNKYIASVENQQTKEAKYVTENAEEL